METARQPSQTTKITPETLRLLRIVSALTGERHYQVLERLVREEYVKIASSGSIERGDARGSR